jgi:hypothetical protein
MIILMGGKKMKNKKRVIAIILLLVFVIIVFSGCLKMETFPVDTGPPDNNDDYSRIDLTGEVGFPLCLTKDHMFVYDTVSHENWSDYEFIKSVTYPSHYVKFFRGSLGYWDLKLHVTYYVRAVAYCYNFKKPYDDYVDGYYQGEEKTFKIY